jgi:hypothetical protein
MLRFLQKERHTLMEQQAYTKKSIDSHGNEIIGIISSCSTGWKVEMEGRKFNRVRNFNESDDVVSLL